MELFERVTPLTIGLSALAMLCLGLIILTSLPARTSVPPEESRGRKARTDPVLAILLLVSIPGGIALLISLPVAWLLLELKASWPVYLMIMMIAAFGVWMNRPKTGWKVTGCSQYLSFVFAAYFLCWSICAFLLAGFQSPASIGPQLGAALRSLIVPLPLVLYFWLDRRSDRKVAKLIGPLLFLAALCAVAFIPVEMGAAAGLLPARDWLRFPIAGMVLATAWIPFSFVVAILTLRGGTQAAARYMRVLPIAALVGGLFGLAWAITRWLAALI